MTAIDLTEPQPARRLVIGWNGRLVKRVAVFTSLALVVLAALAALILLQGINGQITDVVRTYEVRNEASELRTVLSEAESAQRGFLLTGETSYSQTYRALSVTIGDRLMRLAALAADDNQQAAQVRSIAAEIVAKAEEMDRSVGLVESQGTAGTALEQSGERVTARLQEKLQQFVDEENSRLIERNHAIDGYRRSLVAAIITALAGAVTLAWALFTRTQRRVSELTHSAGRLHSENALLEARVQERTQALEEARHHAEQERQRVEALLQDANHRIGNSLATVSSLLGLQLLRSRSEEVREALESARTRVHAIASAHRRLRLGDDMETARADEFLGAVVDDIVLTAADAKDITIEGDFEPVVVGTRDATTMGILVGELVTNALKHAFPDGRCGKIICALKRNEEGIPALTVTDTGVGLASDRQPGEGGLGSVIVNQLANQFGGHPRYEPAEGGGLRVTVPMPSLASERAV